MTLTRRKFLTAAAVLPASAVILGTASCVPQDGTNPTTTIDPIANFPFNGMRFSYLDNQGSNKIVLGAGMNISTIANAVASDPMSFSTLVSNREVSVTGFGTGLKQTANGFSTFDGTKQAIVQSSWGDTEANAGLSGTFVYDPYSETSGAGYYWSSQNSTAVAQANTPADGKVWFLDDDKNLIAFDPSTNPTGYVAQGGHGEQIVRFDMTKASDLHFKGDLIGLATKGVATQAPNGSIAVLSLA